MSRSLAALDRANPCLRAGANTKVETLIVWVVIAIVAVIIVHRKYNLVDLFEAWRERPTPPPLRPRGLCAAYAAAVGSTWW
jgi:hypothetical protein